MKSSVLFLILCLALGPVATSAASSHLMEIGVRGGATDGRHNLDEDYVAAEIYLLKRLPWSISFGESATLATRLDAGLTYLEARDDEGCMLAAGAELVLGLWEDSIEVEVGFRPTWMPNNEYGKDDFGGWLQFTSHAGLALHWQPMVLNYRIQHTSNGSIFDPNPGLNLHMLGLGYRF